MDEEIFWILKKVGRKKNTKLINKHDRKYDQILNIETLEGCKAAPKIIWEVGQSGRRPPLRIG